jgi:hypothetical protein
MEIDRNSTDTSNLFSKYDASIAELADNLRKMILTNLPDATEQVDLSAGMLSYVYGPKYKDLICVIIPSKKEIKLGFNRGVNLPDSENLLRGTGKISRYVVIKNKEQIYSDGIKNLLLSALNLYKELSGD